MQKQENIVRVLSYNRHLCDVNNINPAYQFFHYPNFDIFFNRTSNLAQNLTICSERVKNVFHKNLYQFQEILFNKLDSFGIEYTSEQKLFE